MAKKVVSGSELKEKMSMGSEKVRRTVDRNFGPEGRNSIRDQKYDLPLVGNTGRRILQELSLEDSAENLSAVLVRDAALKVADSCGDGSIATAILTDSLIGAGHKLIAAGYDPVGLRRGLHKALELVNKELKETAIPFDEISLEKLAEASSKNDEVAENVTKAFRSVGVDGVITVTDTQERETSLNLWDGVRYEYGLISTAFITDKERKRTVLDSPYVLLSNVKINALQDIRKILEQIIQTNSSLLIITNDMSDDLQQLLTANIARGLKVAVAKAPGHGDTRRRNMLSLAAKIGSLLFEENTGRELKDSGLEICRRIGRAEIDKESTVLQGFTDSSEEMENILRRHIADQLEKTADADEREKLLTTLSILNGKTAEIRVGAVVEYEMFEKKYLYENAVRTIRSAARSGLVPGAGRTYYNLSKQLALASAGWSETEAVGAACLAGALKALTTALVENSGTDGAVVLEQLEKEADPYRGYDVIRNEMTDLKQAGILVPRNTVESIIRVAAETAGSIWTAGAAVMEVEVNKD